MPAEHPTEQIASEQERAAHEQFSALCSGLGEYEHLPELIPGAHPSVRPITGQSQEDTIDASILAGLTLP